MASGSGRPAQNRQPARRALYVSLNASTENKEFIIIYYINKDLLQFKIALFYVKTVPPDAEIVSSGSWRIGHTGSELRCAVKGNPLPQNVTWSR